VRTFDKERWERLKEIFGEATEIEDTLARRRFVEDSCGEDAEMREEIEELMAVDQRIQSGPAKR